VKTAISCRDWQLITPSVFAVAVRKHLTDWRYAQRTNLDVMTLAQRAAANHAARSQPTVGSCSAARCYDPASLEVTTSDMAAEQPPLAAERLAGLLQESLVCFICHQVFGPEFGSRWDLTTGTD
jgi:hypothetical protein